MLRLLQAVVALAVAVLEAQGPQPMALLTAKTAG
jgi:hypothetical protein